MITAALFLLLALLLQAWLWRNARPARPVGDEGDYLRRAHADDPYRPGLFLRVPGTIALARLLRGATPSATQARLRLLSTGLGLLAVAVTLACAHRAAGQPGLVVSGACLLWLPERGVLNQHIWADPLLALLTALLTLVLLSPATSLLSFAAAGALLGAACLTRIDQVVLLPVVAVLLRQEAGDDPGAWLLLLGPAVAGLAAWTVHNGLRYGRWLPDDTPIFNLAIMRRELKLGHREPHVLGPLLRRAVRAPVKVRKNWRGALRAALRKPVRFLRDVAIRTWSLLGPDSFVSQTLLPPLGKGYDSAPAWLLVWLRLAWPVTIGALVAGLIANPVWDDALAPTVALFATFVVAHTRSRYRLACFPGVALWLAMTWTGDLARLWLALPAGALLTAGLVLVELRREELPRVQAASGGVKGKTPPPAE